MASDSPERQRELIEAGRQYELLEVIRHTVEETVKSQFRLHFGTTTPEEIRDHHIRVKIFFGRWDAWMETFWCGFIAKGIRWLLIAYIVLSFATGNQIFENFLKAIKKI